MITMGTSFLSTSSARASDVILRKFLGICILGIARPCIFFCLCLLARLYRVPVTAEPFPFVLLSLALVAAAKVAERYGRPFRRMGSVRAVKQGNSAILGGEFTSFVTQDLHTRSFGLVRARARTSQKIHLTSNRVRCRCCISTFPGPIAQGYAVASLRGTRDMPGGECPCVRHGALYNIYMAMYL